MTQEQIEQAADQAREFADVLEREISNAGVPNYVSISALVEVAIRIAEASGGSVLDVKQIIDDACTTWASNGATN